MMEFKLSPSFFKLPAVYPRKALSEKSFRQSLQPHANLLKLALIIIKITEIKIIKTVIHHV